MSAWVVPPRVVAVACLLCGLLAGPQAHAASSRTHAKGKSAPATDAPVASPAVPTPPVPPAPPPAAATSTRAPDGRVKLAVMSVKPLGITGQQAELLAEVITDELQKLRRFSVIGTNDIAAMIGIERQRQLLGCSDQASASCLAEIGGALGADYFVVGSMGKLGNLLRLDLKLVSAQNSSVANRASEEVDSRNEEALLATSERMVRALVSVIPAPAGYVEPALRYTAAPSGRGLPMGSIVGFAAAAVLAGTGAVFGVLAKSSYDDELAGNAAGDFARYSAAKDTTASRALLADLCFGGAVVAGGVGVTLLIVDHPRATADVVAATPIRSTTLVLSGSF